MGSSDGREGAASPKAPLTAEDAERFASVLKPMWELDSAPQPTAPLAPPSRPKIAPPVVTVKARQVDGAVAATDRFPSLIAPAASRESSHEFDDLAQLPRGPSAAPGAVPHPTIPELDSGASSIAVQAHLPPRRQQISEPQHSVSVEVDAPPQTVPAADLEPFGGSDGTAPAVAMASFGPTPEQLRARAARGQPTLVINKDELAGFRPRRTSRAIFVGLGVLALGGAAATAFLLSGAPSASAHALAAATPITPVTPATPVPPAVSAATPESAPSAPVASAAGAASPAASTSAAAPLAVAVVPPGGSAGTPVAAPGASTGRASGGKGAAKPRKAPGSIVRSSPF